MTVTRKDIGKRVLVKSANTWHAAVMETTILDVSPSCQYVKLRWPCWDSWHDVDEYFIVETFDAAEEPT